VWEKWSNKYKGGRGLEEEEERKHITSGPTSRILFTHEGCYTPDFTNEYKKKSNFPYS
jgi:hypothetical protein